CRLCLRTSRRRHARCSRRDREGCAHPRGYFHTVDYADYTALASVGGTRWRRKALQLSLLLAIPLHFANLQAQPTPEPLIVHEWGTFTSLQNEASQAIGGINTDDEPVPRFVHR